MHRRNPAPITDETVAEIAAATGADPRTVIRRLAGLGVKGAARTAIDREFVERGIEIRHAMAK
jgi:DNA-binding MurR/RpiR family transcriptional regulator